MRRRARRQNGRFFFQTGARENSSRDRHQRTFRPETNAAIIPFLQSTNIRSIQPIAIIMKRSVQFVFAIAAVAAASTFLPVVAFHSPNFSGSATGNNKIPDAFERTRTPSISASVNDDNPSRRILDKRRKHWINRSLKYYVTVAREQKRRNRGQLPPSFPRSSPNELERQIYQAERHYFARNLIKSGKLNQAERIYRRLINEIQNDEDGCDHARLAVSTLLLALLKQRMNDVKGTRSVFLNFFRTVVVEYPNDKECACSAKVLQAYALFEMKRGHGRKSLEIVERAVELDEDLRPVLAWKQFREVMETATAAAVPSSPAAVSGSE